MQHPVHRIPNASRPAWFWTGAGLSLLVFLPLISVIESGPGIAPLAFLVFAGDTARAEAVLATWSHSDRLAIAFANGLDYLFGLLLFGTLAIGCAASAPEDASRQSRASGAFVWLATLGIVLDIPENTAYLQMILGDTGAPWPQLALATCVPRFGIFFLCVGFIAWNPRGLEPAA